MNVPALLAMALLLPATGPPPPAEPSHQEPPDPAAREHLPRDGDLLLHLGRVEEAEEAYRTLGRVAPWDMRWALGVVRCRRATGRLPALDEEIATLRAAFWSGLRGRARGPIPALDEGIATWRTAWWCCGKPSLTEASHVPLAVARSVERWMRVNDVERLWRLFALDVDPEEVLPADWNGTLPGLDWPPEPLLAQDMLDGSWLRQAALTHLFAQPAAARALALEHLDTRRFHALALLASLHDEGAREPLLAEIAGSADLFFTWQHARWLLLLAFEGSWQAYDALEAEAADEIRGKAARTLLALFPREGAPYELTFDLVRRAADAFEEARLFRPCGMGRIL